MRASRPLLALVLALAATLGPFTRAQPSPPVPATPPRTAEILSYGRALPGLRVVTGRTDSPADLAMLPPGLSLPIDGLPSIQLARTETVNNTPRLVPLVTIPLAHTLKSPLVLVYPAPPDDTGKPALQARIIDQDLSLTSASLHLYNLTQVPMVVQSGTDTPPVQIEPWGKTLLTPKTDRKNRAHLRIAYKKASGEWAIVKDSVSAFRPGYYGRYRILLAAEGLAGGDRLNLELRAPVVFLDEQLIPIPGALPPPPVGEAPAYKHDYAPIEVLPQPAGPSS